MGFPDFKNVLAESRSALARAHYSPTRLAFFYIAVPTVCNLILLLVHYLLSIPIADTGGLGGMGTRSALESMELVLQLGISLFTIFWQMGYIRAVLCWAQGGDATKSELSAGLRRFGPVLRSYLLRIILTVAVCFVVIQISTIVYAASPLSNSFSLVLEQMMADSSYVPDDAAISNFFLTYTPFLLLGAAALGIPLAYRLRMMDFALMDTPTSGAFQALRTSFSVMRGNCFQLFKLDLHFWLFYLLQGATICVFYLDVIFSLCGVELGTAGYLASSVLGMAMQLLLLTFGANRVYTAYATVYEALKPKQSESEPILR